MFWHLWPQLNVYLGSKNHNILKVPLWEFVCQYNSESTMQNPQCGNWFVAQTTAAATRYAQSPTVAGYTCKQNTQGAERQLAGGELGKLG